VRPALGERQLAVLGKAVQIAQLRDGGREVDEVRSADLLDVALDEAPALRAEPQDDGVAVRPRIAAASTIRRLGDRWAVPDSRSPSP
jgi:hypothetical protein